MNVIEIKLPENIKLKDEEIKRIMTKIIEEKLREKSVDINLYRLYFALKYPETRDKMFNFDREVRIIKKMRKKEVERLK